METLKGLFMARQDTFLERTGVGPTTLGRQAVGDPNLVRELRHGRSPTLATADQLHDLRRVNSTFAGSAPCSTSCAAEEERFPNRRTVMATDGLASGTQIATLEPSSRRIENHTHGTLGSHHAGRPRLAGQAQEEPRWLPGAQPGPGTVRPTATSRHQPERHEHQAEITRATELARECMASLGEKESVV